MLDATAVYVSAAAELVRYLEEDLARFDPARATSAECRRAMHTAKELLNLREAVLLKVVL